MRKVNLKNGREEAKEREERKSQKVV